MDKEGLLDALKYEYKVQVRGLLEYLAFDLTARVGGKGIPA
jgi:hypothetical protein